MRQSSAAAHSDASQATATIQSKIQKANVPTPDARPRAATEKPKLLEFPKGRGVVEVGLEHTLVGLSTRISSRDASRG